MNYLTRSREDREGEAEATEPEKRQIWACRSVSREGAKVAKGRPIQTKAGLFASFASFA
jgi:hypothetical protein